MALDKTGPCFPWVAFLGQLSPLLSAAIWNTAVGGALNRSGNLEGEDTGHQLPPLKSILNSPLAGAQHRNPGNVDVPPCPVSLPLPHLAPPLPRLAPPLHPLSPQRLVRCGSRLPALPPRSGSGADLQAL